MSDTVGVQPSSVEPEEPNIEIFDIERGLKLTRAVGINFGALLGAVTLLIGAYFYWLRPDATLQRKEFLFAIWGFCIVAFFFGVWLTRFKRQFVPGAIVTLAIVLSIAAAQVIWELTRGPDALTLTFSMAYVLAIGLADVLASIPFMYITAVLSSGVTAFALLILPYLQDPASLTLRAGLVFVLILVVHFMVAILVHSSQALYLAALDELGTIRIAYERAKKLDELKDQFITNVNHELRNPIMALYNYVDVVRIGGESMLPEKRAELLGQAIQVGDRVLGLLKSILDTRQLDEHALNFIPEYANVREALSAAIDLVDISPNESERTLYIAVPADLAIWGNPVGLQQIFINLLSNALKYSAPGTPIEVSGRVTSETRPLPGGRRAGTVQVKMAEIIMRDYGLGIPPDEIPLLFQRFVRLPRDLASTVRGNGVGLHLCRVLSEAMKGRIWVVSAGIPGQGSAFHVLLPLEPVPTSA